MPFRVKVTAAYGPLMPSLSDLRGTAPAGYRTVAAFARQSQHPPNWFIEEHQEFRPPLLILGAYYDVEAVGEWDARAEARARFERELSRLKLPRPADPVHAELAS
jgi:hypothetical protein